MSLPYRTKQKIHRTSKTVGIVALIALISWFCWTTWAQRYVVYSKDGAKVDFTLENLDGSGTVAQQPVAQGDVSIYYNEGSAAVDTQKTLSKLDGYYISYDIMSKDMQGVLNNLQYLQAGTPVMIELKGGYGSFYYSSKLDDAVMASSINISEVDNLIDELKNRGFYLIAKVSSLADYNFGNAYPTTSGLYVPDGAGNYRYLWMDSAGFYWLNPSSTTTLNWITNVIMELKSKGFNEVMLANFRFPDSDQYRFTGDKAAALASAAATLYTSCKADNFVLSFGVADATLPLPEGRTRLYFENMDAKDISGIKDQAALEDADARLVVVAPTNDSRYNVYGILRPLQQAAAWEAQKSAMAGVEGEE